MRTTLARDPPRPYICDLLALGAYSLLTVVLTWPLAMRLGDVVPADLGDPLLTTWILWWNAQLMPFTDGWWHGPFLYPARDTLALSDHRVGLGLIATPLIWSGASALTAHNVAFLLSYCLSAAAAYALGVSLTRHRGAAFVGGLVFGFHPFRAEHLAHLELLSAYWLPLVLFSLHQWATTRSARWLLLLSVALTMQGLSGGYYFFYSWVLIGGWLLWFGWRGTTPAEAGRLALALAAPMAVLLPVLRHYRDIHGTLGLSRSIVDVERYSADLVGLLSAPPALAVWNTPPAWYRPEGALFPGLTALTLVLVAARGGLAPPHTHGHVLRRACGDIALVAFAVAMVPAMAGPLGWDLGLVEISVSHAYKPLSIATVFALGWLLSAPRVRRAWRHGSPLAFYILATLALWTFALGPTAHAMGHRVLYKAPYAWLMGLPGFADGFRVPARFAMLAALTLSAAAALASARLVAGRSRRVQATILVVAAAGVCLDGWILPFPMSAPPRPIALPSGLRPDTVVVELPLGTVEDAAAMYHAIAHQRPIANGLSGYDPAHYAALRVALVDGQMDALAPLAAQRDVLIVVPRDSPHAGIESRLKANLPVIAGAQTAHHDFFVLPRNGGMPPVETSRRSRVAVRSVNSTLDGAHVAQITDDNLRTAWMPPGPQRGDEELVVDLGASAEVGGVVVSLGTYPWAFPRTLAIDLSADGIAWTTAQDGDTARLTVAAAIRDPAAVDVPFLFAPQRARYLRLRQRGRSDSPWAIAELRVLGR